MNVRPANFCQQHCGFATALLLLFSTVLVNAYPLSFDQRKRLKHYLPNTLTKLDGKDPVHVVLLGEGNLYGASNSKSDRLDGDALTSYAGIFLEKIGDLFFYTGGVKLLNPPPGGKEKKELFQGHEITIENLALPNGTIFSGLQKIQSEVFLHKPDIVMIQYGSTDSLNNCSTYAFRWALDVIVSECKKRNVDVIIVGPTPVNQGSGAMSWGFSRPFASAARGIASDNDVLFFDAGRPLITWAGFADSESSPKAAMALLGDKLERIFHVPNYTGMRERQHINKQAHEDLGRQIFDELLSGEIKSDFSSVGRAILGTGGTVKVILSVQNQTDQLKTGFIGALSLGKISPIDEKAAQRFSIPAFGKQQFVFQYTRPVVGKTETGENILYPLEIFEKGMRFPFVIDDGSKTEFLELPPLLSEPVSVNWTTQQAGNFTDYFQIDFQLRNGLSKALSGTYVVGLGDQVDQPKSFSLPPLGSKDFGLELPFKPPANSNCFQQELFIEVKIGNDRYRFSREMEATRDIVLGEKFHMLTANYTTRPAGFFDSSQDSNWAPTVSFDATDVNYEQSGLYCIADLNGINLPSIQDGYAIKATLSLDGRPKQFVRTFGAISELEFYFKPSGGSGDLKSIPIGAFGNGYNKKLATVGIKSIFQNNQIAIKIPKAYLDQFDWIFNKDTVAGVALELSIADPTAENRFPKSRTFYSNYSSIRDKSKMLRNMNAGDPRRLNTLRFTRKPVDSWYVRIY